MNAKRDLTVDAETAKAVGVFVERVAAQFPVRGAILFGSRAGGSAFEFCASMYFCNTAVVRV